MLKSIKIFVVIAILSASLTVVFAACKKKDDVITPPAPEVVVPVFSDTTVDVSEKPAGLSVGTYSLNKITVNETELAATEYVVRNGYFIFTADYYGFFGVGEHSVKLTFAEGVKAFKLSVVDALEPKYNYSLDSDITIDIDETPSLPVVERENIYQNYDISYKIYNEMNVLVYDEQNIESTEQNINLDELAMGFYTYEVKIIKGTTVVEEFKSSVALLDAVGIALRKNLFGEDTLAEWSRTNAAALNISYDETEKGFKFVPSHTDGLAGRNFVAYYDISAFKTARDNSYKAFSFKVKVNEIFEENPVSGSNAAGLRIYGKKNTGLDGAGISTNTTHGIYEYSDVNAAMLSSLGYVTVTVNLDRFLALSSEINYFAFVVSGVKDSVVWMKDSIFLTEAQYRPFLVKEAEEVVAAKNYASSLAGWTVDIAAYFDYSYDAVNSAIKLKIKSDRGIGAFGSDDNRLRMSISDIYGSFSTYREFGVKYLKFSYKVNQTYVTGGLGGIKVMSNRAMQGTAAAALDMTAQYSVYTTETANTWITEYISLDAFFKLKEPTDLIFTIWGTRDSEIIFKDIKLATEEEFAAYAKTKNILTAGEVNFGNQYYTTNWQLSNAANAMSKSYDSTENAIKLTNREDGSLNNRNFAAYYSAGLLRGAYEAGLTTMTLKIKGDATFTGTSGGGIRIYGKTEYGLDGAGIDQANELVYLYDDITGFTADEYKTVTIDLADFFALEDGKSDNIKYLAFVIGGASGSVVYIKDINFA